VSPGGLATLIIFIVLVVALFGWVGYAYFYPHTWSGQLLIKVGRLQSGVPILLSVQTPLWICSDRLFGVLLPSRGSAMLKGV
jgi:hypothetical protein